MSPSDKLKEIELDCNESIDYCIVDHKWMIDRIKLLENMLCDLVNSDEVCWETYRKICQVLGGEE